MTASSSLPVRFMGKHPLFGKTKRTRDVSGGIKRTEAGVPFDKSPYYWWWRALQLSEAYEQVCKSKGRNANPALAKVYADFGDVFTQSFEVWWRANGARLFGEPPAPMTVRTLDIDEVETIKETVDTKQTLLVAIPLFLTKREIATAVRKIVAKNHSGKRGRSSVATRQAKSRALYKLKHFKGIEPIARALTVVEQKRAGVMMKTLMKDGEDAPSVSRARRMGETIIKHVERGVFPVTR
jgi:hypothetical protein